MAGLPAAYFCIKVFSETDLTKTSRSSCLASTATADRARPTTPRGVRPALGRLRHGAYAATAWPWLRPSTSGMRRRRPFHRSARGFSARALRTASGPRAGHRRLTSASRPARFCKTENGGRPATGHARVAAAAYLLRPRREGLSGPTVATAWSSGASLWMAAAMAERDVRIARMSRPAELGEASSKGFRHAVGGGWYHVLIRVWSTRWACLESDRRLKSFRDVSRCTSLN